MNENQIKLLQEVCEKILQDLAANNPPHGIWLIQADRIGNVSMSMVGFNNNFEAVGVLDAIKLQHQLSIIMPKKGEPK